MSDTGAAPMSRERVDHALMARNADRDRISTALLDVEDHSGYRLIKGARLAGHTRRRWEEAEARLSLLWRLFDAYQHVLDVATGLRARQSRPGEAVLRELTDLLTGPSVELPQGEIPLDRRTLLGPTSERVTLDEAVERMTAAYRDVIDLISAVDTAWEALLGPLDAAEEEWREAARLARAVESGRDAELDRIGRELAAAGQLVRTDPLAFVRDGTVDTARISTARDDLTKVRALLADAARLREEYRQRILGLESSLAALHALLEEAGRAYRNVQIKIASPGVSEPADPGPVLRDRLAALAALRDAGRWPELVGKITDLESTVAAALDQADRSRRLITGLLERRDELRGRMDAYRVKAARLGHAEHDELTRLYEQARTLLWTAPCDLHRSTAVLAQYQRVLRSLETGTD